MSRYEAQGGTKAEAQAEFNRRYGEANPDFSWYNPADLYVREQDFFRSMGAYGRDETTTPFQGYENERQVEQNAKMPLAEQYRQYGAGKMRPTLDGIEVNRGLPAPTARPGAETPAGLEASHNGIPAPTGRPLPVEIVNSGLVCRRSTRHVRPGAPWLARRPPKRCARRRGWHAPTEGQALTLPSTAAEMEAFHAAMEQPAPAKQVFPDLVYPVAPPMDLMPPRRDMTRPGEGAALTLQSDFDTGRFGISPAADDGRGTDALREALLQGRRGEPASTDGGRGTEALRSALTGGTITTSIDALISSQERLTAAMGATADRFHALSRWRPRSRRRSRPARRAFQKWHTPSRPLPDMVPPQRDMTRLGEGAALSLQTVTDGADALRRAMEDGGSTLKISGADAGSSIQSSGTTAAQAILSAAQALERAASSIGENGRAAAAAISKRTPAEPRRRRR